MNYLFKNLHAVGDPAKRIMFMIRESYVKIANDRYAFYICITFEEESCPGGG